jgi:preprotein translocase subunit SecE
MPLLTVLAVLVILGLILWVIEQLPAVSDPMKKLARIVIIVVAVLWLISLFVPGANIANIRVGG